MSLRNDKNHLARLVVKGGFDLANVARRVMPHKGGDTSLLPLKVIGERMLAAPGVAPGLILTKYAQKYWKKFA